MVDKDKLKEGSFEEKIYEKCNGNLSISDIAQEIGKSTEYVGSVVSRLKQKGLTQNFKKNGKTFPKKIHI